MSCSGEIPGRDIAGDVVIANQTKSVKTRYLSGFIYVFIRLVPRRNSQGLYAPASCSAAPEEK